VILHAHVDCHKSEAGAVVESLKLLSCYNTHRGKSWAAEVWNWFLALKTIVMPSANVMPLACSQACSVGHMNECVILGMFVCLIQGSLLCIDHSEVFITTPE